MESALYGGEGTPRADRHGDDDPLDVMDDLESYSAQLRAICGDHAPHWSVEDGEDDAFTGSDCASAAEIASECLTLLESLGITADDERDQDDHDDHDGHDGHDGIPTRQQPVDPTSPSHSNETALLREMNELGTELQALMTALCSPPQELAPLKIDHLECDDRDDDEMHGRPAPVCTSPKMAALTERLERRPSSQRMLVHTALRRHKPYPLGLQSPSPSLTRRACGQDDDRSTTSATRVLLSDAAFWRKYQSKSFQHHLTRQSQARTNQQQAQQNEAKVIEYRYRRVSKPCYPLAKRKAHQASLEPVAVRVQTIQVPDTAVLPKTASYAQRFTRVSHPTETDDAVQEDGLLCGVYLHGKRRSRGMLYLTCTSLEQLKERIAKKFALAQPVVNLYREQVATDLNGARQRKYLHRVASFHELHGGDLLCATTDGYDDMAILCAWMKKRQQIIHKYKSPSKPRATLTAKAPGIPRAPAIVEKARPCGSLTYKKPREPPRVKLWDENGRLVSISQRLPLEE